MLKFQQIGFTEGVRLHKNDYCYEVFYHDGFKCWYFTIESEYRIVEQQRLKAENQHDAIKEIFNTDSFCISKTKLTN